MRHFIQDSPVDHRLLRRAGLRNTPRWLGPPAHPRTPFIVSVPKMADAPGWITGVPRNG